MLSKATDHPAFWRLHIDKFHASGLSRAAYCRGQGLKTHQLAYQLAAKSQSQNLAKSSFAQVVVMDGAPPGGTRGCARLLVGGATALEISDDLDPAWVARLVLAIGCRP